MIFKLCKYLENDDIEEINFTAFPWENSPCYSKIEEFQKDYKDYPFTIKDFGTWCYIDNNSFKLGRGGFGHVYIGYKKNPGEWVAIKKCVYDYDSEKPIPDEITMMEKVSLPSANRHANIVAYFDYLPLPDKNCYYAVLGLYDYTLDRYLQTLHAQKRQNRHEISCELVNQMLNGLEFLHGKNIVHRDLKPNNVMIDVKTSHPTLKLVDFNISREVGPHSTHYSNNLRGMPSWSYPGSFSSHDQQVRQINDLFSALLLTVYIFTDEHPFFEDYDNDRMEDFKITSRNSKTIRQSINFYFALKPFVKKYLDQFHRFYENRNNDEEEKNRDIFQGKPVTAFKSEFNDIYFVQNPFSTLGKRYSVILPSSYEETIRIGLSKDKEKKPNQMIVDTLYQEVINAVTVNMNFIDCGFKQISTKTNWTKEKILNTIKGTITSEYEKEGQFKEEIFFDCMYFNAWVF